MTVTLNGVAAMAHVESGRPTDHVRKPRRTPTLASYAATRKPLRNNLTHPAVVQFRRRLSPATPAALNAATPRGPSWR
jgi:hypothetical protein